MNPKPFFENSPVPDSNSGRPEMISDLLRQARATGNNKSDAAMYYRDNQNAGQQNAYAPRQAMPDPNPGMKPYDNAQYLGLVSKLKMAGIPADKLSFIANDLKEMAADKTLRRGDIACIMEQKWPEIYSRTSDEIRSEVMSLSDRAANIPPDDPKYKNIAAQIERLAQFQSGIDEIQNPKQIFFPDVYQFEENARASAAQNMQSAHVLARTSAGMSQKGAVVKGYRFKGGNPSDKNNWEKI
jgi:hypothetical protein